jgi:hypothetical protein
VISPAQAQDWASFVRWGALSGSGAASRAEIGVDYELERENAVADAVARLDELGDVVDGTIPPDEIERLIAMLR